MSALSIAVYNQPDSGGTPLILRPSITAVSTRYQFPADGLPAAYSGPSLKSFTVVVSSPELPQGRGMNPQLVS